MKSCVVLAAALLLASCYTYRPLARPEPAPGDRVSAQLTTEGSRDLTPQVGPEVLHLEGTVVQADSGGLELEVQEVESFRGIRSDWHGEHVRLPRYAVAGMQQRRLSIGGTTLMGGDLTAGLYLVFQLPGGARVIDGGQG